MADIEKFIHFAHLLADKSNAVLHEYMRQAVSFQTKEDESPVTLVDKKIEQTLRAHITAAYPEHGILGEEYASQKLDAEYVWVIDPIDGTKAFITGMPIYGTLISLTHNGFPILGIIDHPVTQERWAGANGVGATYNGKNIRSRACQSLDQAIISIGNPESLNTNESVAFTSLRKQTKWGIYGGNCYAYGRLAMGQIDISLDAGLDPFDYCALDVVIRCAGGTMSDWEGAPLSIHSGNRVIASGDPMLHPKVVYALQSALA